MRPAITHSWAAFSEEDIPSVLWAPTLTAFHKWERYLVAKIHIPFLGVRTCSTNPEGPKKNKK